MTRSTHEDTHRAGGQWVANDITDIKGRLVNIEAAVSLLRVGRPRRTVGWLASKPDWNASSAARRQGSSN